GRCTSTSVRRESFRRCSPCWTSSTDRSRTASPSWWMPPKGGASTPETSATERVRPAGTHRALTLCPSVTDPAGACRDGDGALPGREGCRYRTVGVFVSLTIGGCGGYRHDDEKRGVTWPTSPHASAGVTCAPRPPPMCGTTGTAGSCTTARG